MMTKQTKQVELLVRRLFGIKDGFYPSGEDTTKRFSVREIREAITQAQQEAAELPYGLKITSYGFDDYDHPTIDRVDTDKYAIRFMKMRFTKRGDWIYEPLPSSRTKQFFSRTQMTLQEAFDNYQKAIEALQKEQE